MHNAVGIDGRRELRGSNESKQMAQYDLWWNKPKPIAQADAHRAYANAEGARAEAGQAYSKPLLAR